MSNLSKHEIRRSPWLGALLRVFGQTGHSIALSVHGIQFGTSKEHQLSFEELSGPLQLTKKFGLTAIRVPRKDSTDLVAVGFNSAQAAGFVSKSDAAWRRHFTQQIDECEEEINALAAVVERLRNPKRYPSGCLLEPFLTRARKLLEKLPESIPPNVLPTEQQDKLDQIAEFCTAPEALRASAIELFLDSDLEAMKSFFDTIESNPLTPEQRLAVSTDEDATIVLAGAGSGKTSVIVAKAAYLINRQVRKPEEILLMAFGKDAATEMATRIEERSGAKVDAMTFHALGNRIIREAESGNPALAAHASDDKQFQALLRDILVNDIIPQSDLGSSLLKWFSEFYWPYKSEWDFETKDEYYQYVEAHELRTFQGELVRSFEEWEIANWLYLNGIAYEYEPSYEHHVEENNRTAYTPDFRLTESGVYIEHFGVRKSSSTTGENTLTTAPNVNCKAYLEGMDWKRKVHQKYETTLVETYSYERVEGRLTEALKEKLTPHVMLNPLPPDKVFDQLAEMGQVDAFTQTLGTFLRHYKSSGTTAEECRVRGERSRDKARSHAFLKIFEPLLEAYEARLAGKIDFEDMIVRATKHVEAGRYKSPYRHLLVDEFQDISEGRARLLKALKAQHDDARIFAVGDDWQSIYRFTGSDIHLMREFGDEFGGVFAGKPGIHSSVDLGRTFRSVDKIALPARAFVLQNPSQITKQVVPAGTSESPAIMIEHFGWGQEGEALEFVLKELASKSEGDKTSVLLLGRYNFLRPDGFPQLQKRYPSLSLKFMTVHRSKGLEADHVVVLNAVSGKMGFPSEIVDDPLLDLVLPKPEDFDHAEERRLFYVALTRARKTVTVLADRQRPSVFARELLEKPEYQAVELSDSEVAHRKCKACGGRMLLQTSSKGLSYFQCEHRKLCGETLRPCRECGKDVPTQDKVNPRKFVCSCGAVFSGCPKCFDGWLDERKGKWGSFLGCVRYPDCTGRKSIPKKRSKTSRL